MSPAGWLYIEDDAERYCPDRDIILAAYARSEELAKERGVVKQPSPAP
jgi:hypothetical protein